MGWKWQWTSEKVKCDLGNELTKKGKILPSIWKAGAQDQGTHVCWSHGWKAENGEAQARAHKSCDQFHGKYYRGHNWKGTWLDIYLRKWNYIRKAETNAMRCQDMRNLNWLETLDPNRELRSTSQKGSQCHGQVGLMILKKLGNSLLLRNAYRRHKWRRACYNNQGSIRNTKIQSNVITPIDFPQTANDQDRLNNRLPTQQKVGTDTVGFGGL